MVQERRKFLVSVLLAIFVYVELKCQSLTMTPQGGSALEDTFVLQDNNQKNVLQVFESFKAFYCFLNSFLIFLHFSVSSGEDPIIDKCR